MRSSSESAEEQEMPAKRPKLDSPEGSPEDVSVMQAVMEQVVADAERQIVEEQLAEIEQRMFDEHCEKVRKEKGDRGERIVRIMRALYDQTVIALKEQKSTSTIGAVTE